MKNKFIESYPGNGRKILTHKGYVEILEVHKTIKLSKFQIKLENGIEFSGAENHVIIGSNFEEIFIKDSLNKVVKTVNGNSKVIYVKNTNIKEHMYDISIDSEDELYYSNGILSHNSGKSVTVGIYLTHLALFEKDVNIGIAAQKHSMSKEFLTKVKDIFIELPIWLTPGVKVWNMTSISLENGVRVLADTASSDSFRGHTCLRGDSKIKLFDIFQNKEIKITFDELYNILNKTDKKEILRDINIIKEVMDEKRDKKISYSKQSCISKLQQQYFKKKVLGKQK